MSSDKSAIPGGSREEKAVEYVDRALKTVRRFLGLDVAFITEVDKNRQIIRHLDTQLESIPLVVGMSFPLDVGYSLDIREGRLPAVIPDTMENPVSAAKPETASFSVGAYVGVPIPRPEGGIYGRLCCFNQKPTHDLGERDLQVMKAVGQLIGSHLDLLFEECADRDIRRMVIEAALAVGMPDIAYQPVFSFDTEKVVAAEALSRFNVEPLRTPDKWFADAADVGMELVLSEVAIRRALKGFAEGFARGMRLGINMSPKLICKLDIDAVFDGFPADQIVIEITEHEVVEDYEHLNSVLAPLRKAGVAIVIDDMGAGYSNSIHVLRIVPDCLKVDASIVEGIDRDPMKQAWLAGIMEFSRRAGCDILAEGIESEEELATLRALGVHLGQGFLLGRPMSMQDLLAVV